MSKICCFTGHRKIAASEYWWLSDKLDEIIAHFYACGYTVFRVGGALGFDTMVEKKVLALRDMGANVELELYLPCGDQAKAWNEEERRTYEEILRKADRVFCLYPTYTKGCMFERNRRMVDGSDLCIGYCQRPRSGSGYTISYAQSKGVHVLNLATLP